MGNDTVEKRSWAGRRSIRKSGNAGLTRNGGKEPLKGHQVGSALKIVGPVGDTLPADNRA